MKTIIFVFCFAAAALAQQNDCASAEARVEAEVKREAVAADDVGAFRTIGDQALAALGHCPDSARLWYLAARSAEVLESPTDGQAFAAQGGLKTIVANALSHNPSAAPVLTVAARVQHDSSLARKAFTIDPNYQPARRALAELLAQAGSLDQALRLTADPQSGPMHLTRARVLLAAKRPAEAVAEARKVVTPGTPDEIAPSAEMYRNSQEVLGFALLDLHKNLQAQKALRNAASAGSVPAQKYLASQSVPRK